MRLIFRPFVSWPGAPTRYRKASPFSSTYPATLELLERELSMLGTSEAVLQLDLTEAEIRTDGRPRANARPAHPGVVVAFESRHGPLQYATDVFDHWQDNLRAIALSLEALRKVDRYGISKRGEQYTGWRALPASPANGFASREEAARFILASADFEPTPAEVARILADPDRRARVFRDAAKRLHPDVDGGDPAAFARLEAARKLIES